MKQAVEGISDLITMPGIINIDFADVRAIMESAGGALMGIGRASGEKRAEEAAKRSEFQIEQRILQSVLPLWDDAGRGIPNPFIRSGLFTVGSSDKRDFLKDSTISSLSTYNITYTGSELQQDDLSVWMSLINPCPISRPIT